MVERPLRQRERSWEICKISGENGPQSLSPTAAI